MSYKLRIERDADLMSPREWDNVGIIVASHKRYNLGDSDAPRIDWSDFDDWEAIDRYLRQECGAVAVLPVYLYDHSGITISTTPFSCRWDSGQVGAIYATAESVSKLLGDDASEESILQALRDEVVTYNQYVVGDVWGYVVEDQHGNVVDSCWGFYGEEYATEEGESALRYCIDHEPLPCTQEAPACTVAATDAVCASA